MGFHGRVLLDNLAQERAALDVFELQVQVALVLERRIELHDERATIDLRLAELSEHLAFVDDVVRLLHPCYVHLGQDLQRNHAFLLLVVGAHDPAEVTDADLFVHFEVG